VNSETARAARSGDQDAFALLISENLAGMRAVAMATLGPGDEAEDAVQDAVLTALRKISQLQDPAAAGPWLKAIVRNNCRMLLRSLRAVPVGDPESLLPADPTPGPEEILEQAATRDWVRAAVSVLPEPVREVTLLRYFTAHSSYAQIADLCAVPVDTVRSRLRDGRRALERALRGSAPTVFEEAQAQAAAVRREAADFLRASRDDGFDGLIRERFHPHVALTLTSSLSGDSAMLRTMADFTYGAGVLLTLSEVAVSRDLLIWETDFVNPPDKPGHCPPGLVWLHSMRRGRTQRLRLAYRLDRTV